MPTFSVPYVAPNSSSWGPPDKDEVNPNDAPVTKFALLPYAPFGRSDRLGRCADFTGRYQGYHQRDQYHRGSGGKGQHREDNEEFQYRVDKEQSSFQLVDTSKATVGGAGGPGSRRFVTPAARRRQHSARLRQVNARRSQQSGGGAPGAGGGFQHHSQKTRNAGRGGRGGRGGGRGGRWGGRPYQQRVDRQASVSVQPDWKQVEEMALPKLIKSMTASADVPEVSDVLWCGFLETYNDVYDKVTSRSPVPLKRMETVEFYPVTPMDDPVLEKLAIDQVGNVFITDAILSHLMTCTRSVYPWDLVIQKLPNGTLFFDKRDNSVLDYLTVHETSYNPPTTNDTSDDGINTPERLGLEATSVHQNFTQQILRKHTRKDMDLPNPFYDEDEDNEGMEPAAVAFRYRKFDLGQDVVLVCRTELHGIVKKNQYMTAFALNEYIPSTLNWRDKMESQFGAVLANELKNNSFQLAKWTAQSLLAGADQMKIGFVSRKEPKNAYEHVILATQFYRPKDFAQQINVSEGQMWAMIRMFVQLMQKQEPGKYVLMRDPNKAIVRLFAVPPETFEEDE